MSDVDNGTSWTRITEISKEFVDGRHFHDSMMASMKPHLLGGWSNKAISTTLTFEDCIENEEDPTRFGVWTSSSTK